MPDPKPQPNDDLIQSEQRAAERRTSEEQKKQAEADAEVNRQIEAQKAKVDAEALKAKLRPQVAEGRAELAKPVAVTRERVKKLRAQADALERIAGDLEGAIITAGDVARTDPERALAGLIRARDAFQKATKSI